MKGWDLLKKVGRAARGVTLPIEFAALGFFFSRRLVQGYDRFIAETGKPPGASGTTQENDQRVKDAWDVAQDDLDRWKKHFRETGGLGAKTFEVLGFFDDISKPEDEANIERLEGIIRDQAAHIRTLQEALEGFGAAADSGGPSEEEIAHDVMEAVGTQAARGAAPSETEITEGLMEAMGGQAVGTAGGGQPTDEEIAHDVMEAIGAQAPGGSGGGGPTEEEIAHDVMAAIAEQDRERAEAAREAVRVEEEKVAELERLAEKEKEIAREALEDKKRVAEEEEKALAEHQARVERMHQEHRGRLRGAIQVRAAQGNTGYIDADLAAIMARGNEALLAAGVTGELLPTGVGGGPQQNQPVIVQSLVFVDSTAQDSALLEQGRSN